MKRKIPPLILESVYNKTNLDYLSLINYRDNSYLTIIDNIRKDTIHAFVLDLAESEGIDIDEFLSIATQWYYTASERYPLSFEFNRRGMIDDVSGIIKTFNINYTRRVVGKPFIFSFDEKPQVRHKKAKFIQQGIPIKLKKVK